jgi:hypothetical protein
MVNRSDLERVKKAKDLSVTTEYRQTDQGRRLAATIYSSKQLGISAREEVDVTKFGDGTRPQNRREHSKAAGAAMSEEKKE